jgi:hypothetical protein
MAIKYYTLCRHTGPAQPFGTSGKIEVKGLCPKCNDLSHRRPEVTIRVVQALLNSYRNVRTSSR